MRIYANDSFDLHPLGLDKDIMTGDILDIENTDTGKSEDISHMTTFKLVGNYTSSHFRGIKKNLIVLSKRSSLWPMSHESFKRLLDKTSSDALGIMCMKLTNPRGSANRRWISWQGDTTNFNINIIIPLKRFHPYGAFDLQKRIAISICDVLSGYVNDSKVSVKVPFHYCIDNKKVAGHLVSQDTLDGTSIIRIGIGINTDGNIILADNDQFGKELFDGTGSLGLSKTNWIPLFVSLVDSLVKNLEINSNIIDKEFFGKYFELSEGDFVDVYGDSLRSAFGRHLGKGKIIDIDKSNGLIKVDTIENGLEEFRYGDYIFVKNK